MTSMSVNLHDPSVVRVSRLDDTGTITVELGGYPHRVTLFIHGGLDGFGAWVGQLLEKAAEGHFDGILVDA